MAFGHVASKELEGLSPEMTLEEYVADQLKAILCPQAFEEARKSGTCAAWRW